MPYETFYVDSGKGVHKVASGVVTSAEILFSAHQQAALGEGTKDLKYALVDFSLTTDLQMTPDAVRQLVEINRQTAQWTPGRFIAIVAPGPLSYGMSRLWQSFTEDIGWNANVFHSRPAAISWLLKQFGAESEEDVIRLLNEFPSLRIQTSQIRPPSTDETTQAKN